MGTRLTMAMELMSRERFENQLRRAGLFPTDNTTGLCKIWATEEGCFVSVPELEEDIPDWILDDILKKVEKLHSL